MTDHTRQIPCQRTVTVYDDHGGQERTEQCPWRGTPTQWPEHTVETIDDENGAHQLCGACSRRGLTDDERQTCSKCIQRLERELREIEDLYATLPEIVERSGYRMGKLPGGNALVMLADGSVASPQTPNMYTEPRLVGPTVHVEHPQMPGDTHDHPAYVEERVPSNGREHLRDHWPSDPLVPIALLEGHERDWRRELGQPPADEISTVVGSAGYLRRWLTTAARTHPAFDVFARDIHDLHHQLTHVTGVADDPESAKADCTRCGGRLQRAFREPTRTADERLTSGAHSIAELVAQVRAQRAAEATYGLREHQLTPWPGPWQQRAAAEPAMRGSKAEGLADVAVCADCGHTYTSGEYRVALRLKALAAATGWVTPAGAAQLIERSHRTVWTWIYRLEVVSRCRVEDRRIEVDLDSVKAKAPKRRPQTSEAESA